MIIKIFRFLGFEKIKTGAEKLNKKKESLVEYFNSKIGKKIFDLAIRAAAKGDKEACPLHQPCSHWFAKNHDKDFPNFFVNPCWQMPGCLCPLRQNDCVGCYRKKDNNPLC